MAKTSYQAGIMRRIVNKIVEGMIRLGMTPDRMAMLTVAGRKSGQPRSLPVSMIIEDDATYLVSPYGEVNWVKNARIAGEVKITRGRKIQNFHFEELDAQTSALILKRYLKREHDYTIVF